MANTAQSQKQTKFLRLSDVTEQISASGSSVWNWVRDGSFPAPVKLSPNCTAWVAAEVEQWAADRIANSRKSA